MRDYLLRGHVSHFVRTSILERRYEQRVITNALIYLDLSVCSRTTPLFDYKRRSDVLRKPGHQYPDKQSFTPVRSARYLCTSSSIDLAFDRTDSSRSFVWEQEFRTAFALRVGESYSQSVFVRSVVRRYGGTLPLLVLHWLERSTRKPDLNHQSARCI